MLRDSLNGFTNKILTQRLNNVWCFLVRIHFGYFPRNQQMFDGLATERAFVISLRFFVDYTAAQRWVSQAWWKVNKCQNPSNLSGRKTNRLLKNNFQDGQHKRKHRVRSVAIIYVKFAFIFTDFNRKKCMSP